MDKYQRWGVLRVLLLGAAALLSARALPADPTHVVAHHSRLRRADPGPYATKIIIDDHCPPTFITTVVNGSIVVRIVIPPRCPRPISSPSFSLYRRPQPGQMGPDLARVTGVVFKPSPSGRAVRGEKSLRFIADLKGQQELVAKNSSLLLQISYVQSIRKSAPPVPVTIYTTVLLKEPGTAPALKASRASKRRSE